MAEVPNGVPNVTGKVAGILLLLSSLLSMVSLLLLTSLLLQASLCVTSVPSVAVIHDVDGIATGALIVSGCC